MFSCPVTYASLCAQVPEHCLSIYATPREQFDKNVGEIVVHKLLSPTTIVQADLLTKHAEEYVFHSGMRWLQLHNQKSLI